MAQQYLTKTNLPFLEINIDQEDHRGQVDVLWQLLRNWREDPHTPLVLPVLTQHSQSSQKEDIVLVGYDPQEWSDVLVPNEPTDTVSPTSNMPLSEPKQSSTMEETSHAE